MKRAGLGTARLLAALAVASVASAAPGVVAPAGAQGAAARASAQGAAPLPDSTVRAIDALFADHAMPASPGCAVGVYRDGAVVFAKGYGSANLNFAVPITPETRFTVGSVSKQFTAASIALLVRAWRLSLDDDVRRFIPELPDYGTPIRVRHLVHHTSGLRDFWELVVLAGWRPDDGYTTRDMLALAAAQRALNNAPGARYLYSNTGYLLLGEIVRRVTGQSLRAFADSAIFRPLGMRDSFFLDDHDEVVPRRATAYSPAGHGWTVNVWNNDLVGQGGLVTTIADLQKWDENFYTGAVGGPGFLALMRTVEPLNDGGRNDYAFGLELGEYRGLRLERHTGATGGYRAAIVRAPAVHTSFVMLCNAADARTASIPLAMADLVIGAPLGARDAAPAVAAPPPQPSAAVAVAVPRAFTGRYESAELLGTTWDITPGPLPSQLTLRRARGASIVLEQQAPGTFTSRSAGLTVVFDATDRVPSTGLTVTFGEMTGLRFVRVASR
ncbi:MAG: beta-lactamase family protein [Gemmatimonadetes bacterium]|nr:beta-lactamase family protein [Gemmatimonadota bacterium]